MRRFAVLLLLVGSAAPAFCGELPTLWKGVRPLGMGGAFTAVANDENALFYNPAGLDRVEGWGMGVLNPVIEVNKNGLDFYQDAQSADLNEESEVTDLLRDYNGDYMHMRTALMPNFYTKHFAFAVLAQESINVQPNAVMQYPIANIDSFGSVSANAGVGWGFLENRILRVGAAARYVKGYRLQEAYDAEQIASDDFEDRVRDDLDEGSGVGFDAGLLVELPYAFKPTIALAVQNIGDVDLGDAGLIRQQVNFGVSATYVVSWLTLLGAADYRDVTHNVKVVNPLLPGGEDKEDDDLYKRIHLGLEARLPKILAARVGLYQGYFSFGAGVDLGILQLDYASYAEEVGAYAGQRYDRRHALQVSLGW